MSVRASGLVATAAFVGTVPAALALGYLGYRREFYPYPALPFVVAGLVAATVLALLAVLPRVRWYEERR